MPLSSISPSTQSACPRAQRRIGGVDAVGDPVDRDPGHPDRSRVGGHQAAVGDDGGEVAARPDDDQPDARDRDVADDGREDDQVGRDVDGRDPCAGDLAAGVGEQQELDDQPDDRQGDPVEPDRGQSREPAADQPTDHDPDRDRGEDEHPRLRRARRSCRAGPGVGPRAPRGD